MPAAIQAATEVVLHFVGIMVMTTQTNLTSTTSTTAHIATDTSQGPALVAIIPPVDFAPHTPLIAFSKTISVQPVDTTADANAVAWPLQDLRPGISYALIDPHDQVTFQAGLATAQQLDTKQFLIPRLREAWATDKTGSIDLADGYKGPNYSSAVATVKVTEGRVSGCSPDGRPGRADTIVTLNSGILTIKAGHKQLRLAVHDQDEITIANVPLGFAQNPAGGNANHYRAYCAMASKPIDATQCTAPPVTQLGTCLSNNMIFPPPPGPGHGAMQNMASARMAMPTSKRKAPATASSQKQTTKVGTKGRVSGVTEVASTTPGGLAGSADCSNTQWP